MATREVDESTLQALDNARALLDGLYTDPELGLPFKEMIKKKYPKARIPDLDAAAPAIKRVDGLEKKLDEVIGMFKKAGTDWKAEQDAVSVRSEFSFTDEGMDRVKKRAADDGIPLRAAAALLIHEAPEPVQPSGISGSRWNLFAADSKEAEADLKKLVDDPDAWLEAQVPKILGEHRARPLPVGV